MDLLAGYNDETENSQTPEKRSAGDLSGSTKDGEIVGGLPSANLDTEWENFEKLLAGSAYGGDGSASADIHVESTGYKISDDEGPEKAVPKAYAITRSRSRSISRSRSHSSGSTGSSRSSSADSQKGKKGKGSSSSSDEAPSKEDSKAAAKKTDAQEKTSRSPPIIRKERSATPVEKRKSKSRSKSKSVERRKGSRHRSRSHSRSRGHHSHGRSSRRHRRSRSRGHEGSSRGSRSKRHRRSRSRDHHRHSRRRKSHDRSRSRDRHDKRDHQRRRHRSRSHGRDGRQRSPKRDHGRYREEKSSSFRAHEPSKPTFKEKMRQQLMKASKLLTEQAQAGQLPPDGERPLISPKEKPSDLPLNVAFPNMPNLNQGTVTPQMALLQTMAVMHQKAQEMTGIAVPKYYNPAAVNPLKYAEQVQKRKLLWSKNKEKKEETQTVWEATNFNADNDGKVTAKFRKLMGMKEGETEGQEGEDNDDINRKQQELFHKLDQQYEFARMTTHTHRGIGLGFQSQGMPDT